MRLANRLGFWKRLFSRQSRPATRRPARPHLQVESLEVRDVPTVLFQPHFGAETIAPGSQNEGMQSPPVFITFLGPYWGTAQGRQDEGTLLASTMTLLNSPYFTGLKQYGSDGVVTFGASWEDLGKPDVDDSGQYSSKNVRNFLQYTIDNQDSQIPRPRTPDHAPIYVVVTDPISDKGYNGGWNSQGTYKTPGWFTPNQAMHMIWVGTSDANSKAAGPVSKDIFTSTLSHELAETISDPDGQGIHVITPAGLPASVKGDPQIGDNEPAAKRYGYRLNGQRVQPYWSAQDNAFIVPDGKAENFILDPIWNGATFTGRYRAIGSWSNIDGRNDVASVVIDGTTNTLYAVNANNHGVYRYDGGQSWTSVDPANDVRSLAVDKYGSLYALSFANHGIWKYGGGQSWTLVGTDTSSMDVDKRGDVYAISFSNHGFWKYDRGWGQLSPDVASMGVDKRGDVFVLSSGNHGVWKYDNGWTQVGTDASSMGVDKWGDVYAVSFSNHGFWQYDGGWGQLSPDVASMGVDKRGDVFVLSSGNHGVWKYDNGWTQVGTDASSMGIDKRGDVYAISFSNHGFWKYDGGWGQLGTDASSMGVDKRGDVYVVSSANHGFWQYDGGWGQLGTDVQSMGVDKRGDVYAVSFSNHGFWKYDRGWGQLGTSVASMGIDKRGDIYAISFANHGFWKYDGGWGQLGTDAASMGVDKRGDVYVISSANHGFWKYDGGWGQLGTDAASMGVDKKGDVYVLSSANHGVWKYDGGWANVGRANDVQSLAVDNKGDVYVLSFANHGVWRYNGGQSWTNVRPANDAATMVADDTGALYILSSADSRTYRYDSFSNRWVSASGSGSSTVQLAVNPGWVVALDASALGVASLYVDGAAYDATAPFSVNLLPGAHSLTTNGTDVSSFTVNADGTVTYDPALVGALTETGMGGLVVHGYAVALDASALGVASLYVDGAAYDASAPLSVNLLPGQHTLTTNGTDMTTFTVNPDGTVAYDPALEGALTGSGTTVLAVHGYAVTLDASALGVASLTVDGMIHDATAPTSAILLPGQHSLTTNGSDVTSFTVNADGSVAYDPALEGALTGSGTAALAVHGYTVTLDATALGVSSLALDGMTIDGTASTSANLLPGQHTLTTNGTDVISFTVNADGSVTYDPALEGALTGSGTTALAVHGYAVTLDASALGVASLTVDGVIQDATAPFSVNLLPGQHTLSTNGTDVISFTVNPDGTVTYDPALEGALTGSGSTSLVFQAP